MTEQHAAPRPHRTLRRVITALMAAALTLTMAGPAPGALPSVPVQTALINRTASSLTVLVNKTYPRSPLTYVPAQLTTVDGFQMRPETATAWSPHGRAIRSTRPAWRSTSDSPPAPVS